MQNRMSQTFNVIEFEDAIEGATDIFVGREWSTEDIHEMILSTMADTSMVHGELIPLEWKTGFIFGAISDIVIESIVKKYGGQIQQYLNRH